MLETVVVKEESLSLEKFLSSDETSIGRMLGGQLRSISAYLRCP